MFNGNIHENPLNMVIFYSSVQLPEAIWRVSVDESVVPPTFQVNCSLKGTPRAVQNW